MPYAQLLPLIRWIRDRRGDCTTLPPGEVDCYDDIDCLAALAQALDLPVDAAHQTEAMIMIIDAVTPEMLDRGRGYALAMLEEARQRHQRQ